MGTTLVVNPGSSSRKYALYKDGRPVLVIKYEGVETGFQMCSQESGGQQICKTVSGQDFKDALTDVSEQVDKYLFRESAGKLEAVIVRVVASGTDFQKHEEINEVYIDRLKKKEPSAPLHIPIILKEIEGIKKNFKNVRILAASDSAFHAQMPTKAREYSIDSKDAEQFDIHRFGYHGLSVSSIVNRIHAVIGQDPQRMIVCHIGSGTSVTAVKKGKSIETTMGFSPASGLPMGSRAGDLDAAAFLELMRDKNLKVLDAEIYLNTNGGLYGMSQESDIRTLLDKRSQNDPIAKKALEKFAYSIQKAIASSVVALGGVDALVLTATAAVRSTELRELILKDLDCLGMNFSKERNDFMVNKDGVISKNNSPVKIVVMRTDEMGEMNSIASEFKAKS